MNLVNRIFRSLRAPALTHGANITPNFHFKDTPSPKELENFLKITEVTYSKCSSV